MKYTDYLSQLDNNSDYQSGLSELKSHFALGDAIIRARIKKGLSQADLAEMVGTKQANISRIESALGNPTLKLINKILRALELEINFVSLPSTNSYKSIPFQPGIAAYDWPTKTKISSSSSQSDWKLSS